ncbi:MAG: radical SAM protein [Candidatus Omnitrophota bacterium]
MKILFLNPKIIHERWPFTADTLRVICKALGVAFTQLAAMVEDEECRIFDAFVEKISMKDYVKMLKDYDIIAMSMVPPQLVLNMEIAVRMIRKVNKNAIIVLGGHHATAFDREWIEKGADIIVKHEGEETFKELVEVLKNNRDLSSVKGITYKNGENKIVSTKDRDLIESLDDLPLPRWDLVNFEISRGSGGSDNIAACLETSRGCIGKCNFCWVHWMWKRRQRYKSAGRVVEEMRRLYALGCRNIIISDDNFGGCYERDLVILKELARLKMDLNIWLFLRADTIFNHPDLVEYASKAGAREIFVGFEDLNVQKVDANGKKLENVKGIDDYKKVYAILKKNNILVVGCFVQDLLDVSDSPSVENAHCSEICDMSQHAQVIPLKGSGSYEKLWSTRLKGVDPFYAGILTGYELNNRGRLSAYRDNFKGLMNKKIIDIFTNKSRSNSWGRKRVLNLYMVMIKNVFRVDLKKIMVFLWCFNPLILPEQKQKMILNQYLNEKFIGRLVKKGLYPLTQVDRKDNKKQ